MNRSERRAAASKMRRRPHFSAFEVNGQHEHIELNFAIGDRVLTVLDGCVVCGRLAGVDMDHCAGSVTVDDPGGGWTNVYARLVEDPLGFAEDGSANHLCADCIAKYGRPLPAAVHAQLDKLNAKIWPELKLRYGCACEIKWINVTHATGHPGGARLQ